MKWFIMAAACAVLISACTTENPTQPDVKKEPTYLFVGEATVDSVTVQLYADTTLIAGYNVLHVKATVNGKPLAGHVHFGALMDMGMMKHSCPVVSPPEQPDEFGYYNGAILFTMAGSAAEWSVLITAHDTTSLHLTDLAIPVTVGVSSNVQVSKNGTEKTIIALLPHKWMAGKNDIQFSVFRGTDPEYATIDQALLLMTPTMPSMGHGSSGNINPVQQPDGLYKGTVNFSMTGEWRIDLDVVDNMNDTTSASFTLVVN